MQTNPDDRKVVEELVKKAQQGHPPAFAGLYELYYDQIYRYVSFKCGNPTEAEDITGEVFLKMLESIHAFKWQGHPFTSWLYRIAHVPLDDAEHRIGVDASDLERAAEINMTMTDVISAMDSLTDLQREVISLRFGSGLSVAETAQAVGRKNNAVKALQHAGLKKLRALMVQLPPAISPAIEGDARI